MNRLPQSPMNRLPQSPMNRLPQSPMNRLPQGSSEGDEAGGDLQAEVYFHAAQEGQHFLVAAGLD